MGTAHGPMAVKYPNNHPMPAVRTTKTKISAHVLRTLDATRSYKS
jgi:hypothetical protein